MWETRPDGCIVQYNGWGEVEPYHLGRMASLGKKLPTNYLRSLANRWRELQQKNSPLRAVINGKLVSVSETLYDTFILRELDALDDEFRESVLVGQVLGKNQLGISDGWIALRVEQFIKEGLLLPITTPAPNAPIYHRMLNGDGIISYVAERIFQLEPEPPAVDSLNEYILSALREKNLLYFSFFLHHYETQLNKRIKGFLSVDGGNLYDTDRFIDIKISCREQMLQKLMDYDPAKGAEYATYIYPVHLGFYAPFSHGRRKMVGVLFDQLQNGAINGVAVP